MKQEHQNRDKKRDKFSAKELYKKARKQKTIEYALFIEFETEKEYHDYMHEQRYGAYISKR